MIATNKYEVGRLKIMPGDVIPEQILKDYPHIKKQNEDGEKRNKLRAEKAKAAKSSSADKA